VSPELGGQRLDQIIALSCDDLSRTYVRKLIDIGGVHLQGRRVRKCALTPDTGAEIEIFIDGRELVPYRIGADDVIYRDKYILALNKPAGIAIQPTPARFKGTIYEALLHYLSDPNRRHIKPELAMVQRLDRDTSGVVIFSIHKHSHKNLTAAFTQRRARKVYLALVAGCPSQPEGSINSMLARHRASGRMKSVRQGGKEAVTRYRVLNRSDACSLLEVEILTGRTHQIRVHMSEAGWPIMGDTFYGGSARINDINLERAMLHASSLELPHPCDNDSSLNLSAPLPADFIAALSHAGINHASVS
jgi:23S rRNA pseudouridine1911/1915/1917 synthase